MADDADVAPLGCIAPALGAQVSSRLGDSSPLELTLQDHFDRCLACQLERRGYDRFVTLDFASAKLGQFEDKS